MSLVTDEELSILERTYTSAVAENPTRVTMASLVKLSHWIPTLVATIRAERRAKATLTAAANHAGAQRSELQALLAHLRNVDAQGFWRDVVPEGLRARVDGVLGRRET